MGALEAVPNRRVPQERGNPEYLTYLNSARWQKLRRAVRLRANGKCEICTRRDGADCAHLTYDRIFHEPMSDLLWVCRKCHGSLDQPD